VQLGRPWTFEAVLMAVLLAHEKVLDQVRTRLEAIRTEKDLPEGILPSEGQAPSQEGEIVPCWLLCTLN
jgi:hypothetical protein